MRGGYWRHRAARGGESIGRWRATACRPEFDEGSEIPIELGAAVSGRTMLEGRAVHIVDVLADPEYKDRTRRKRGGFRTVLGVPLLREGT